MKKVTEFIKRFIEFVESVKFNIDKTENTINITIDKLNKNIKIQYNKINDN